MISLRHPAMASSLQIIHYSSLSQDRGRVREGVSDWRTPSRFIFLPLHLSFRDAP
jgi:hypothetical protein